MNIKDLWRESAVDDGDIPNVVRLNLPRGAENEGAAWIYIPAKDTIYIGGPGSYHVDISLSLTKLVPVPEKDRRKIVTGVLYDDGYSDLFTPTTDKKLEGRILRALQMWHENSYGKTFNEAEDEAGWPWSEEEDESGDYPGSGYFVYPRDEGAYGLDHDEDDDDDEKMESGRDTTAPSKYDHWNSPSKNDYRSLKPTPGAPKPISQWDVQDYLDWRDKKYWNSGSWSAREDFPHWRWSFGDSSVLTGCPHEGLWMWPTHNGYPDHFSQTGQNGLGRCAQGRVYPHEGDRWEILTWPDRPRQGNDTERNILQEEAQKAVKQYLMEKVNIPANKIFFTNMHYGQAVTWYDSPSYPAEDYTSYTYPTKEYAYDWEPLESFLNMPEGKWNKLKDPSGAEWELSGLAPDTPGYVRMYRTDGVRGPGGNLSTQEIDPKSSTAGWQIGKRYEVTTTEPKDDKDKIIEDAWKQHNEKGVQDNPLQVSCQKCNNDTERFTEDGITGRRCPSCGNVAWQHPVGEQEMQVTNNPSGELNPNNATWHVGVDGSKHKIVADTHLIYRDGKFYFETLTPEQKYALRIKWFEEDNERMNEAAKKIYPDAYSTSTQMQDVVSFKLPDAMETIHVPLPDYELAYRLHGDNWWKSFIPDRDYSSPLDGGSII